MEPRLKKQSILAQIDALRALVQQRISDGDNAFPLESSLESLRGSQSRTERQLERILSLLEDVRTSRQTDCPLSQSHAATTVQLIARIGDHLGAQRSLRTTLAEARGIEIWDPYFFEPLDPRPDHEALSKEEQLAAELHGVLPDHLESLTITARTDTARRGNSKAVDRDLFQREFCKLRRTSIKLRASDSFHDRIWVLDEKRSIAIGTSFNGLGLKKPTYIVELAACDHAELYTILREQCSGAPQQRKCAA